MKARLRFVSGAWVPVPGPELVQKQHVLAQLVERGSNFRRFALARGYEPRTVTQVVDRWIGGSDLPRGRLSFRILIDLSNEVGKEVVPGLFAARDDERAAA